MRYNTEKIRSLNSLAVWLEKYGVEVNKKGFAHCPFHHEKTASFKVYADGTYHCFGCGAHGDVITFVMGMQRISFAEACDLLDGDISYSEQRKIEKRKRQKDKRIKQENKVTEEYWKAFDEWRDNEEVLELFRPSGPEDVPNALFLDALQRRGRLAYNLDLAETEYISGR